MPANATHAGHINKKKKILKELTNEQKGQVNN